MLAKSVDTRCPALQRAEGQYRAKRKATALSCVCNEHVPATEVKMCSELGGNVESTAEMTAPHLMVGNNMPRRAGCLVSIQ